MNSPVFDAELELRDAGADGSRRVVGRFPYGKRAIIVPAGGGRRAQQEQFAARAFAGTVEDQQRDVHLLAGHSFDKPLASRSVGTLILNDGPDALAFTAIILPALQRASWVQDLFASLAAGLIGGVSPGFRVAASNGVGKPEETTQEGDAVIRTIRAAELVELSLVTRPAYDQTQVDLRQRGDAAILAPRAHVLNRWRA